MSGYRSYRKDDIEKRWVSVASAMMEHIAGIYYSQCQTEPKVSK